MKRRFGDVDLEAKLRVQVWVKPITYEQFKIKDQIMHRLMFARDIPVCILKEEFTPSIISIHIVEKDLAKRALSVDGVLDRIAEIVGDYPTIVVIHKDYPIRLVPEPSMRPTVIKVSLRTSAMQFLSTKLYSTKKNTKPLEHLIENVTASTSSASTRAVQDRAYASSISAPCNTEAIPYRALAPITIASVLALAIAVIAFHSRAQQRYPP